MAKKEIEYLLGYWGADSRLWAHEEMQRIGSEMLSEIAALQAENDALFDLAQYTGGCSACRHSKNDDCEECEWIPDIPGAE
ncbi:MAG: hypothetical protein ACP5SH_25460 [Syntrophobacteraceae bacterium]